VRVLLINQYFPPDTSATAGIAKRAVGALTDAGHDVTVLAGRPSYAPTARSSWRPITRQRPNGARLVRVGSTAFARHRIGGRIVNYLSYVALATPAASAVGADVVLVMTDPPFAPVVGALAARLRRRPLVVWMQDVHPEAAIAGGMVRAGRVTRWWGRAQRAAVRSADAVIVLGDDMRERVLSLGVDPLRVTVLRTGADLGPPPPAREVAVGTPLAQSIRAGDPFVVVHAGNIGTAGAWPTVVAAASRLANVTLVFVGDGAARSDVERRAAPTTPGGRAAVRFHPFVPTEHARDAVVSADLHLVTVRRGVEGLVVPSKLYGILAAGRPVLAVCDRACDVAQIVERHRCGLVADPDDADDVGRALAWAVEHPDELEEMGRRARDAAIQYDMPGLLAEFVKIVEAAG